MRRPEFERRFGQEANSANKRKLKAERVAELGKERAAKKARIEAEAKAKQASSAIAQTGRPRAPKSKSLPLPSAVLEAVRAPAEDASTAHIDEDWASLKEDILTGFEEEWDAAPPPPTAEPREENTVVPQGQAPPPPPPARKNPMGTWNVAGRFLSHEEPAKDSLTVHEDEGYGSVFEDDGDADA
ncbi:uncharacterized protein M421DRAFT_9094 [Didymella exigua CBS 183.55]|uniref:Uncharacterized protein n=1 Tax=Didymella exigua CBS 183.55 TaxID=1150837 RepID=A0A6A5RA02_9PLEO|nr:uncharacterized protein M421DRAFT_9094 [Didymella exigua CBS 183.55]KAF1924100.1 hypothetical protein M421DRAFT_9094 [Didymella exigua CBS 183.55]